MISGSIVWLVLGIVAGVLGLLGLVLFLVWMGMIWFAHGSGWSALAPRFACPTQAPVDATHGQTVMVGMVYYKRCASIAVMPDGLYLAVPLPKHPALLIPWKEIVQAEPISLNWRQAVRVVLRDPQCSRIVVPGEFAELITERLRPQ